jgi:hypothetical protein
LRRSVGHQSFPTDWLRGAEFFLRIQTIPRLPHASVHDRLSSLIDVMNWYMPSGTEENHEKPQSGQQVRRPGFEPITTRIKVYIVTATVTCSSATCPCSERDVYLGRPVLRLKLCAKCPQQERDLKVRHMGRDVASQPCAHVSTASLVHTINNIVSHQI